MKRYVAPEIIEFRQHLAKRIKEIRVQKNWSRLEAAIETDINPNYYARLERGKTGRMRATTLIKILKGFGISSSDLLNE